MAGGRRKSRQHSTGISGRASRANHTYSSKIHPSNWRGFLDYGTQMIGDWGNPPVGAGQLGPAAWEALLALNCTAVEGVNPVTYPSYACKLEFPERPNKYVPAGKMPPVVVYWYEGTLAGSFKPPAGLTAEDIGGHNEIFVGTKGFLGTSGRGESYHLLPVDKMQGYTKPDPVLKRSPGHFEDWIRACQGRRGGVFQLQHFWSLRWKWMLLGAICWRFPNEKLLWDAKHLRFTNNEKARTEYMKPKFRQGWELNDVTV